MWTMVSNPFPSLSPHKLEQEETPSAVSKRIVVTAKKEIFVSPNLNVIAGIFRQFITLKPTNTWSILGA